MESPSDDAARRRSIDRRTLIRRAAAAGAAAWAAPVIIGSIASPAAAATFNGCFQASSRLNTGSGSTASWASWISGPQSTSDSIFFPGVTCIAAVCQPPPFVAAPSTLLAAITASSASAPFGSNLVTVSVPTGCRIVAVAVATSPDTVDDLFNTPRCDVGRYSTSGLGNRTVTITPNGGFWDSSGPLHSTITLSIQCP